MKVKLVRITTKDKLELHGLLFEPDKKITTALVHVHGWIGNFYENKFIDEIAKEVVSKGLAFLTFNNRGTGIVSDLIKRKKTKVEYIRIGGSLENFEDCVIDIEAAINFLDKSGYKKIILQGHSLGCQKTAFYKYVTKDKRIQGLILLAPVDDVDYAKSFFKNKYRKSLNIAKKIVKIYNGNKSLPKWMEFYPLLKAKVFLNVVDPKSSSGKIFDYSGNLQEIKSIRCPLLAVFGSADEYQSKPAEKLQILKNKVKHCDILLIEKSGHGFVGFEKELSKLIVKWIKDNVIIP